MRSFSSLQWIVMSNRFTIGFSLLTTTMMSGAIGSIAQAKNPPRSLEALHIVVNSNDDRVTADDVVTLREAIELLNGQRRREQLTPAEQRQVTRPVLARETDKGQSRSRIEFDLPAEQRLIQLDRELPALLKNGLTITGMNDRPGQSEKSTVPQIAIVPAPNTNVARGLTIVADGVTIRGLSLAGFNAQEPDRLPIVAGDIVIGHRAGDKLGDRAWRQDITPQDVVIEDNWLGVVPSPIVTDPALKLTPSSFGVYAFFSQNAIVQRNRIENHHASGIITGVVARDMTITQNTIVNNGQQGMADGIRLEGDVANLKVTQNKIQANAGSGIYLFNPQGVVTIAANQISNNGQRFTSPAIFLTGNGHQVESNQITSQNGSGIVIAADPKSWKNQLRNNQFANLQGLAIDLVSRHYVQSSDRINGDGPNRPIREYPSRLHIANGGIDAPTWLSSEFFPSSIDGAIELVGQALPQADVEIYSNATASGLLADNLLPIAKVKADAQGRFRIKFEQLQVGEQLRAIANHDDYGTSEFSDIALVRAKP
jgi:hypothetical protein